MFSESLKRAKHKENVPSIIFHTTSRITFFWWKSPTRKSRPVDVNAGAESRLLLAQSTLDTTMICMSHTKSNYNGNSSCRGCGQWTRVDRQLVQNMLRPNFQNTTEQRKKRPKANSYVGLLFLLLTFHAMRPINCHTHAHNKERDKPISPAGN